MNRMVGDVVEWLLTFDADEVSRRGGASRTWIDTEQACHVPIWKVQTFTAFTRMQ